MKTTVDVPDELLIRAKKRAAELRQPRVLVGDGLRMRLAQGSKRHREPAKLRFLTVEGGLPPGLDLTDRAKTHA